MGRFGSSCVCAGHGEPNGGNIRVVHRFGGKARIAWRPVASSGSGRFEGRGPYDDHRNFNLTFSEQSDTEIGYTLDAPRRLFTTPQTSVGVCGIYRTLALLSPSILP